MRKLPIKEQVGSNTYPPNKILSVAMMLLSMFTFTNAFAESGRSDYDLDDDGLIEINDLADLNEIRNHLDGTALYSENTGCSEGGSGLCNGFELSVDLDFDTDNDGDMDVDDTYWNSGEGWEPLGNSSSVKFTGVFDGNNHVINNLYINRPSTIHIGLFGYVSGGTLKNTGLSGSLLSVTGNNSVGSFAGVFVDTSTLINCYATGLVQGVNYVGGLLGEVGAYATITNSHSAGTVQASGHSAGGLAGLFDLFVTLNSSYNTASVSADHNVGGLVGRIQLLDTITNNFSTGSVQGDYHVGGLLGQVSGANTIHSNFSTGLVSGDTDVGGLIGDTENGGDTVSNMYWALDTTAQATSVESSDADSYVGVSLAELQCAQASDASCAAGVIIFNTWDDAIWDFGSVNELPGLIINGVVHRDADGDSLMDANDAFPFVHIGSLTDTDKDGAPDECDATCLENGMTADTDDDNDGTLDVDDGAPLDPTGTVDSDGDGTSDVSDIDADNDGLIEIANLADLNEIRNNLDGSSLNGLSGGCLNDLCNGFELTSDLDFDTNQDGVMDANDTYWNDGLGWTPIGTYDTPFSAILDGNGFEIRNLYINQPDNDTLGLFASMSSGEIRNLGLSGLLMSITGESEIGAFVGEWQDDNLISHSYNTGSIQGTYNIGGLVGYGESSNQIINSYNSGAVQGSEDGYDVGGLVGFLSDDNEIINSHNSGAITGYGEVGGLVGYLEYVNEISNSYNSGEILTTGGYVGGLVGYLDGESTISNSYNVGPVQADEYAGGLIGYVDSDNTISGSYNTGAITSNNSAAGLVAEMSTGNTIIASFNTGSVQGGNYYVAGFVGYMGQNNQFISSYNTGDISGGANVAGLVGFSGSPEASIINASFNTGRVTATTPDGAVGGIISVISGVVITNSYWATDSSGQALSDGSGANGYLGLTLSNLSCAIQANTTNSNSDCNAGDFYTDWDAAELDNVWDFGNNQQLPSLIINGNTYRDSDGDGSLDSNDAFPLIHIGSLTDTDGDGAPDECDADCINIGMSADTDDDNDGTLDIDDEAPLDPTGTVDSDNDGVSDASDIDGDNDGLIEINSLSDLDEIRNNLDGASLYGSSDGCAEGGCNGFELTTDLDFDTNQDGVMDENDSYWNAGEGWVAIGEYTNEFTALFEGNDHVIRNLYINRPDSSRVGLFGSVEGASDEARVQIRNLGLSGTLMSVTGSSYVGALAGYAANITITASYNTGSVQAGGQNVGGLIGRGGSAITINDSYNSGAVLSTNLNVGGLLGYGQYDIQIINSYNLGSIQGSSTVGGLVGVLDESRHVINASYNTGTIQATGNNAGGLFGHVWNEAQVTSSFNTGSIQGDDRVGGLVGSIGEVNQISSSFNTGSVTATGSSVGGLVGNLWQENTITSSYNSGGVNGVSDLGGLIGAITGDTNTIENSYWATDSSGQATSVVETGVTSTQGGFTLANLQCAVQANTTNSNSDCAAGDFYTTWDNADLNDVWDFGTSQQLPSLILDGVSYRDSDGDGALDDFDADGQADVHDLDDDNDGVLDVNDAFPFITLSSTDTDQDGIPDDCDDACESAGMTADTDDDNDGLVDSADGYPLTAIGELTDTDNDGRPDDCDQDCIDSGMGSDTDDDNDNVLDSVDGFPLINIGDLTDTDQDGRPDECDQACIDLGMSDDTDDDNDGVLDINDAFSLISLNDLTDTDQDGRPDECDQACIDLGMSEDTDDDNDGVLDINDAFSLISLNGLTDTDQDGRPDDCDQSCIDLGMSSDNDDDNDGILDSADGFPLISIGDLTDTDNDGLPDNCDQVCIDSGMSDDTDDDNDGVLDVVDAFPLDASESNDLDNDGIGDISDTDDDNDGVLDVHDTDNTSDNGVPELTQVPEESSVSVNSVDGKTLSQVWDAQFFTQFSAYDAVDSYNLTYEAHLNNELLEVNEDNEITLPTGRLEIQWRAKDSAGNVSNVMTQIINVFPQVSFNVIESITGDNGVAHVVVELSGQSPIYPVSIALLVDSDTSTVNQDDFDVSFDMNSLHRITIEESSDPNVVNLQGTLNIAVSENDGNEYDEVFVLDLIGVINESEEENLFTINEQKNQHALIISYHNLAPAMTVTLEQNGVQILLEENQVPDIKQQDGPVLLTVWVSDPNFTDTHTLDWDVSQLNIQAPEGRSVTFNPEDLLEGEVSIHVTATDSGINSLSCELAVHMNILIPEPIEEPSVEGSSTGSGSLWWLTLLLSSLVMLRRANTK